MLLSLLFLGVALVVIGMERQALIYAWRTRPGSLPEGGGRRHGVAGEPRTGARPPHETPSFPLSDSALSAMRDASDGDCGYETVLPDRIVTRHGAVVSLADHDEALL